MPFRHAWTRFHSARSFQCCASYPATQGCLHQRLLAHDSTRAARHIIMHHMQAVVAGSTSPRPCKRTALLPVAPMAAATAAAAAASSGSRGVLAGDLSSRCCRNCRIHCTQPRAVSGSQGAKVRRLLFSLALSLFSDSP